MTRLAEQVYVLEMFTYLHLKVAEYTGLLQVVLCGLYGSKPGKPGELTRYNVILMENMKHIIYRFVS